MGQDSAASCMSLTPAYDARKVQQQTEEIELCGKNRGPHDYIPIEWKQVDSIQRMTRLLCRICFKNIETKVLLDRYPEIKF